ncbi:hypothetical protein V8E36_000402 [Tilletia maclaganii]
MTRQDFSEVQPSKRARVQGSVTFTGFRTLANRSLAWSEDGRLAFATTASIHILTPSFASPSVIEASHAMSSYPAYIYAGIQPQSVHDTPPNIEVMGIDADAGLSLRTFERPPVREVLWSPLGIAKDGGCYLSVLDSTLHMHLYAASPNGWTGSWKESPRPSLPMMEIASKREALIDLHIMSHCWTERLPDARKPTSLLLASTRTGRLLYESGVQVPPNPELLQVPTHVRGHITHIVACRSWSPASTDTRSQSPISMQSCTVALWTPALSEVAFIDLLYSSATGAVSCRVNSPRATLQGCHGITLARFVHPQKFAMAMPGQVKVIDLLSTAQDHTRTYSFKRSPADERSVYKDLNPLTPVIDISSFDKKVLYVTLADGSIYELASQPDSSSTNSGACVPTDVLTVHLEGQADADLQEQVSIRRPFNGFALMSSLQAPSLPQLFAVSQTTDELSSLPRVVGERRSGTITLMLSHPFNSAQYGPEQERGVEALLKAGFSASNGEAGNSDPGSTPSSLFSPLLAYFVGLEDDAQRQASTGIWRLLQPYITAQQDGSLSIEQLRKLNYILIWL